MATLSEPLMAEEVSSHESPGARAWRRLVKRKSAVLGLAIIIAIYRHYRTTQLQNVDNLKG